MVDLVIIGAGVAGLMAAGVAASHGLKVVVCEKMEKPARKLRITGKGRCNITNDRDTEEFVSKISQGADFVLYALERFTPQDVCRFFESQGVALVHERGGRVFPASSRAWDVAEALVSWARKQGADIRCNSCVEGIDPGFVVKLNGEQIESRCVLITTGGVSYPSTGSTGDGYGFAYDFGHEIVSVRPALVALDIGNIDDLKGLSLKNTALRLVVDSAVVQERFGDVEFTDRGIAGATVLQVSRWAVDALTEGRQVALELDLKPALSQTKLRNRILREMDALGGAQFKILLQKLIPSTLLRKMSSQCAIAISRSVSSLSDSEIDNLVQTLKSLSFEVLDYRPFSEAIITAGGVSLEQVDSRTMESYLQSGLYFAGEVLDVDADTGGFNIQIALCTAHLAAESIVTKLHA